MSNASQTTAYPSSPAITLDDDMRARSQRLKDTNRWRYLVETIPQEPAIVERDGRRLINFSSNDYLGLGRHPEVIAAAKEALERYGAGGGASRLISGNHPLYPELESLLAEYKGTDAALVFSSGYAANLSVIERLMGKDDIIIADKLAHACILDGSRISGAAVKRFAHNDIAHLDSLLEQHRHDYHRCLIITETVFSMDGDIAPLSELRQLADTHGCWLMTDDAHGLGLLYEEESPPPASGGRSGGGKKAYKADLQTGTLSKAAGSYGGYLCASQPVIEFLAATARPFVFSTALPPATIAASIAAIRIMQQDKTRCAAPLKYAQRFCNALGLPVPHSPIVPVVIGDEAKALSYSQQLAEQGLLVMAIRPPTVPEGTSRLRITFSAAHNEEQVRQLISALKTLI